jgi:hypothetical protein
MEIILKGGPLDGKRVAVPAHNIQYAEWKGGKRIIYVETTEKDTVSGLTIYAFKEIQEADEAKEPSDA